MNLRILRHKRIWISRIAAVLLIGIFLFTRTEIENGSLLVIMKNTGLLCISIGVLGRIWSSLFICGRKSVEIVDQGPYSTVRNPLYLFSFVGVAGIALSTTNLIFIAMILILFIVYYPLVVIGEERKLTLSHGERFLSYMRRTPRFLPDFSKLCIPDVYEVDVRRFSKAFLDAIWFFAAYILIDGVKYLQAREVIPIVFSL
jgi:protein-S-isoprenylcysteine O-methyltransferase Ste14